MVTKNEERKALEQIKKIIEKLGDDSYIAVAFEGCFEIAEENIDNDFACSMEQKYTQEHEQVVELLKKVNSYYDEIQDLEKSNEGLLKEIDTKDQMLEHERSMKRELNKELDEQDRHIESLESQVASLNEDIAKSNDELIHLKAKMYDMICGQ